MGTFFRGIVLLAFGSAGVAGAFRVLDELVSRMGGADFRAVDGGIFLMFPVGLLGALFGALVGGMLLPRRH